MEGSTGNSLSSRKTSEGSTSDNDVNKITTNISTSSVFVNHAKQKTMDWRSKSKVEKKAKGSNYQHQQEKLHIPSCSGNWSTTYEDLLCNNEPFPEAIPLSEMVDFLVDIWHDDGLYD